MAQSVGRELRAAIRNRARADERIFPAGAQNFLARMKDDLDIGAALISDESRAGRGGPADQRKRNFFEKLETMWHGSWRTNSGEFFPVAILPVAKGLYLAKNRNNA
jgi:hypothetical protein